LLKLLPFVIAILAWVINHFAGQAAKPPQRGGAPAKPAVPPKPKPAIDPLQSEIDEFLRQAQALREGKTATQRGPSSANRPAEAPLAARGDGSTRQPPPRRQPPRPPKRVPRREEPKPVSAPSAPLVVEVVEAHARRESVAQHVAQSIDSSKFAERATQLSQMQRESDAEFQQHMQRVFQHDVGTLQSTATEAIGAGEVAAAAPVARSSSANKPAADIALLLAGRKNIRDAIVLSEILQRPAQRW
jgi:hypothetical protein